MSAAMSAARSNVWGRGVIGPLYPVVLPPRLCLILRWVLRLPGKVACKCQWIVKFEGKEGQGEKHQCVVAFHAPPTGYLACNPRLVT